MANVMSRRGLVVGKLCVRLPPAVGAEFIIVETACSALSDLADFDRFDGRREEEFGHDDASCKSKFQTLKFFQLKFDCKAYPRGYALP